VLADRGRHAPWGIEGGLPGAATEVFVKKGKRKFKADTKFTVELEAGDYFEIRTAGGGGYGKPENREPERIKGDVENRIITPSYAKKNYHYALRSI
jgi:N-methylhydantoinase B